MNPILQFPKRGRSVRRSAARRGPPAEILFFTGVRYERQGQVQTTADEPLLLVREASSSPRSRPRGKKSA
jgi:hypothetical protein